jgi:hypothetical protein
MKTAWFAVMASGCGFVLRPATAAHTSVLWVMQAHMLMQLALLFLQEHAVK